MQAAVYNLTGAIFPEGISAAGLALRGLVKFAKQNMANTADARVAIFFRTTQ